MATKAWMALGALLVAACGGSDGDEPKAYGSADPRVCEALSGTWDVEATAASGPQTCGQALKPTIWKFDTNQTVSGVPCTLAGGGAKTDADVCSHQYTLTCTASNEVVTFALRVTGAPGAEMLSGTVQLRSKSGRDECQSNWAVSINKL